MSAPLLEIDDLHAHFVSLTPDNTIATARALNGVTFAVDAGEVLGLVGETGAGKSLTALSIMGLLRPPARIVKGRVVFEGRNLLELPPAEVNRLRGSALSLIVQSPATALDPLARIGDQLVRLQRDHRDVTRSAARAAALAMLHAVGIPDPERRLAAWPHELSGGMAQRVVIAMALINAPRLVIADEPTTGLDVTVQAQILGLLANLVRARGLAAILVTHDLGIVAHHCARIAVMFAGRIVESGPTRAVFAAPRHPYTQALLDSIPRRGATRRGARESTPPPDLLSLPEGCHYRDRCPRAEPRCATTPDSRELAPGHRAACHFA
jgi:peptide/nickel transport system ATP-binding protein/oligopeptide transport system ATP-binding protein